MAIGRPDEYVHNNPNRAIVDSNKSRGGLHTVADKAARNAIPEDMRSQYMVVSYGGATEKYTLSDVTDPNWTDDNNWEALGTGTGITGLGTWNFNLASQTPPPGTGEFITDNATIASSTKIYIHETDQEGIDKGAILNFGLEVGVQLYIQQTDNKANYLIATIASITDQGTYVEFDITDLQVEGTITATSFILLAIGGGQEIPNQNYRIFDNIAGRDALPVGERVDGLLAHVKSPYSWYQLVGGIDNINWVELNISRILAGGTLEFYLNGTGSDTTGDGTVGNPYRQPLRAAQDVPKILSNTDIYFYFGAGANYVFDEAFKSELGKTAYSACNIFFIGTPEIVEAGVSMTEAVANKMLYNANKVGVTLTENQWRGYFLLDGSRAYPISYNSAGSDNFTVEYMRGARNGTRDIVDMTTVLDMSTVTDNQFLEFNFIGLPKISFEFLRLSRPGGTLEFTTLKAFYDITFGTRIDCLDIRPGQFSEHSIMNLNFTGTYIECSANDIGIDCRNGMGNMNMTRCVVYTPNNIGEPIIYAGKNAGWELREVALVGGGSGYALQSDRESIIALSKTVIVRNVLGAIHNQYEGGRIQSSLTQGYVHFILNDTDYAVYRAAVNTQIDIIGYEADGALIEILEPTNVPNAYDEVNGIRINLVGETLNQIRRFLQPVLPKHEVVAYAATVNLDLLTANDFTIILTGNITINLLNFSLFLDSIDWRGSKFHIHLLQDGTGSRVVTFGTGFGQKFGTTVVDETGNNQTVITMWADPVGNFMNYMITPQT